MDAPYSGLMDFLLEYTLFRRLATTVGLLSATACFFLVPLPLPLLLFLGLFNPFRLLPLLGRLPLLGLLPLLGRLPLLILLPLLGRLPLPTRDLRAAILCIWSIRFT